MSILKLKVAMKSIPMVKRTKNQAIMKESADKLTITIMVIFMKDKLIYSIFGMDMVDILIYKVIIIQDTGKTINHMVKERKYILKQTKQKREHGRRENSNHLETNQN